MSYVATREQLELTAKALGYASVPDMPWRAGEALFVWMHGHACMWNPVTNAADSANLGDDLEIEVHYVAALGAHFIWAGTRHGNGASAEVLHDNTIEGRRAAVRWARFLVAAEIGRNQKVVVKLPTNTMEQEFQTHYRRGYHKGLAEGHKQGMQEMLYAITTNLVVSTPEPSK